MQISLDTSNIPEQDSPTRSLWYDRIWASFVFFTRLPFWRIYQPKKEAYKTVVEHWPLTGWLTGCMMAAVIWFGSMVMPYPIVIILAILTRLLITGALHEDGLADFIDGFGGGGSDRQRILDIMKDSHIGTYGETPYHARATQGGTAHEALFAFLCPPHGHDHLPPRRLATFCRRPSLGINIVTNNTIYEKSFNHRHHRTRR